MTEKYPVVPDGIPHRPEPGPGLMDWRCGHGCSEPTADSDGARRHTRGRGGVMRLTDEQRHEALQDAHIDLLREHAQLRAEVERLKGTISADDARLVAAAVKVWGESPWGCDTAEHLADVVLALRAEVARLNKSAERTPVEKAAGQMFEAAKAMLAVCIVEIKGDTKIVCPPIFLGPIRALYSAIRAAEEE